MRRREFIKNTIAGAAFFSLLSEKSFAQTANDPWKTEYPKIIAAIKPPKFKKKDYLITKFGATADGHPLCTQAIKAAIEECHKKGGGRVVVPAGVWLTGTIHLKSNVNLHVSKGATLKFSTEQKDYLPMVLTRYEGMEMIHTSPLIYAFEQQNIAVTGEGTLDGQGKSGFWKWTGRKEYGGDPKAENSRSYIDKLYDLMTLGVPVSERVFGVNSLLRPNFIQPYKCKSILIEGVKIVDSPMWEIHPVLCENVTVRKIQISTHGPNNDGCNPESCKNVLIEDCFFDTGDDCIAIKSGKNEDGRRINVPSENIIVRNCVMKDGHGGITIGSEISGGVRNVFAENNLLDSPNLWTALRVKNNASRGGKLENLYFRNIKVGQVSMAAIVIDFNYGEGAKGNFTPVVKNYVVDNLTCQKAQRAVDLQGLDKSPVDEIHLQNCNFAKTDKDNIVKNVNKIKLDNVRINGKLVEKL